MKTLALLAALLLLAFQAQAEPLPGAAEEALEEALEQPQPGEEDREVTISFAGDEGLDLRSADARKTLTCRCRSGSCGFRERLYGVCKIGNKRYLFCCR